MVLCDLPIVDIYKEKGVYAILDEGCNSTVHGDVWGSKRTVKTRQAQKAVLESKTRSYSRPGIFYERALRPKPSPFLKRLFGPDRPVCNSLNILQKIGISCIRIKHGEGGILELRWSPSIILEVGR